MSDLQSVEIGIISSSVQHFRPHTAKWLVHSTLNLQVCGLRFAIDAVSSSDKLYNLTFGIKKLRDFRRW